MSTSPNLDVVLWLDKLEISALLLKDIASHEESNTIRKIIARQINILRHHASTSGGCLGSNSGELRRVIELYNTFRTKCKFFPAMTISETAGLDVIMITAFRRLDAEEVARDLKFYTELRSSIEITSLGYEYLDLIINNGLKVVETEMAAIEQVRSALRYLRRHEGFKLIDRAEARLPWVLKHSSELRHACCCHRSGVCVRYGL